MNNSFPSIVTAIVFGCALMAQEPPPRQPTTPTPPATKQPEGTVPNKTAPVQEANSDAILITCLLVDNENEIALSRIALQRAQNPEIKQFAQKMIDDHGGIVQKLQKVAGGVARVGSAGAESVRDPATGAAREPKGEHPAGDRDAQPKDASGIRAAGASFDHERLTRDLGRKCLESATALLTEKQGADFDRCYMGMQLGAHIKAVDTIEVFRNYASPGLRPTLDEGLQTVQMHLEHVKSLVKQIEVASLQGRK